MPTTEALELPDVHTPAVVEHGDACSAFKFQPLSCNQVSFSWSMQCHAFCILCVCVLFVGDSAFQSGAQA